MNQQERMKAGKLYKPTDIALRLLFFRCRDLLHQYNRLGPRDMDVKDEILRKLFGKCGEYINIETPFHCDYGFNIEVGENFYANFNLVILDVAPVIIGSNVFFGPNVSLYAASHPIHPKRRNAGVEFGLPISIGDNVWLGGSVVVTPGVNIGDNAVIGAGSVVTRDIPANMVAAGNPARPIREINEGDMEYYAKGRSWEEI